MPATLKQVEEFEKEAILQGFPHEGLERIPDVETEQVPPEQVPPEQVSPEKSTRTSLTSRPNGIEFSGSHFNDR
ncbi:unnamed protein product [Candida parapsilosis]